MSYNLEIYMKKILKEVVPSNFHRITLSRGGCMFIEKILIKFLEIFLSEHHKNLDISLDLILKKIMGENLANHAINDYNNNLELMYPVRAISKILRNNFEKTFYLETFKEYLSAILEYLTLEILHLTVNIAEKMSITPHLIYEAIKRDDELSMFLENINMENDF